MACPVHMAKIAYCPNSVFLNLRLSDHFYAPNAKDWRSPNQIMNIFVKIKDPIRDRQTFRVKKQIDPTSSQNSLANFQV